MLRTLTQNGYVSHTLLSNYNMYKTYIAVKSVSKINRYQQVAKEFRVTMMTVRRAVKDMKAYVKN